MKTKQLQYSEIRITIVLFVSIGCQSPLVQGFPLPLFVTYVRSGQTPIKRKLKHT